MSVCKFCNEEIEWKDGDNGRKVPVNPNTGQRHQCKKEGQNTSTSSVPPAATPGAKAFDGKILSINHQGRKLALDGGAILTWTDAQDQALSAFKPGYRARVEHDGEHLISIVSTFQAKNGQKGGKQYAPRNEKIIVLQSSLKVCADLFQYCHTVLQ